MTCAGASIPSSLVGAGHSGSPGLTARTSSSQAEQAKTNKEWRLFICQSILLEQAQRTMPKEAPMPCKFEIYKDKAGEYRFRLKANNGQIMLASEGYKTKASAMNGVASVRKNAAVDARFERKDSKGKFRFNLKATNGQVIGTSERYETEKSMENGVQSIMKNAPEAKVEDLTAAD
jgi:uncharacterized protein YegP (UPF0339 family)